MLQSKLFAKIRKLPPKDAISVSHKFLVQGGFVDMLMAGVYTYLPLGWKVISKISDIIREEMNNVGGQEMLMPALQPKAIWDETGRWESLKEIMYQWQDKSGKETGLAATHEEVIYDLVRRNVHSYRDLPFAVYQIQSKFRHEPRPRGGIMRGREFMMKDLYSFHLSQEDLDRYYDQVKKAYIRVYDRCGLKVKIAEASGGVFTQKHSHEFQLISEAGEDNIVYCEKCDWAQNEEIASGIDKCPVCGGKVKKGKSIEVGNIFQFEDKYAKDMNGYATSEDGQKKPILMASYGIGISRLVASIAEIHHDKKGIIWPDKIAPFRVHLISLGQNEEAKKVYQKLVENSIETLFDDRDSSAGEKFADADLIGIPERAVISAKTKGKLEIKKRKEKEAELLTLEEFIKSKK